MKLFFASLLLFLFSCQSKKSPGDYFELISKNDVELKKPRKGEWRESHQEPFQSLSDYKKLHPKKAEMHSTKIYLVALGDFTSKHARLLEDTRDYLSCFFQLEVAFVPAISEKLIPAKAKRINGDTYHTQLLAPYIMDSMLKGKIPRDGYALMAISERDLYPKPEWNFVFGMASYAERVGVSSIYRYIHNNADSGNYRRLLRRIIATSAHEIGHMFSIKHCVHALCGMNGSNSLPESDRQPLRFCSECQKKLHWNIQYDQFKRQSDLMNFLKSHEMQMDLDDLARDTTRLKALEL